jgi:hypothetical protein
VIGLGTELLSLIRVKAYEWAKTSVKAFLISLRYLRILSEGWYLMAMVLFSPSLALHLWRSFAAWVTIVAGTKRASAQMGRLEAFLVEEFERSILI